MWRSHFFISLLSVALTVDVSLYPASDPMCAVEESFATVRVRPGRCSGVTTQQATVLAVGMDNCGDASADIHVWTSFSGYAIPYSYSWSFDGGGQRRRLESGPFDDALQEARGRWEEGRRLQAGSTGNVAGGAGNVAGSGPADPLSVGENPRCAWAADDIFTYSAALGKNVTTSCTPIVDTRFGYTVAHARLVETTCDPGELFEFKQYDAALCSASPLILTTHSFTPFACVAPLALSGGSYSANMTRTQNTISIRYYETGETPCVLESVPQVGTTVDVSVGYGFPLPVGCVSSGSAVAGGASAFLGSYVMTALAVFTPPPSFDLSETALLSAFIPSCGAPCMDASAVSALAGTAGGEFPAQLVQDLVVNVGASMSSAHWEYNYDAGAFGAYMTAAAVLTVDSSTGVVRAVPMTGVHPLAEWSSMELDFSSVGCSGTAVLALAVFFANATSNEDAVRPETTLFSNVFGTCPPYIIVNEPVGSNECVSVADTQESYCYTTAPAPVLSGDSLRLNFTSNIAAGQTLVIAFNYDDFDGNHVFFQVAELLFDDSTSVRVTGVANQAIPFTEEIFPKMNFTDVTVRGLPSGEFVASLTFMVPDFLMGNWVSLMVATPDVIADESLSNPTTSNPDYLAAAFNATPSFQVLDRLAAVATLELVAPANRAIVTVGSSLSVSWTSTGLQSSNKISVFAINFESWEYFAIATRVDPTLGALTVPINAASEAGQFSVTNAWSNAVETFACSASWVVVVELDSNSLLSSYSEFFSVVPAGGVAALNSVGFSGQLPFFNDGQSSEESIVQQGQLLTLTATVVPAPTPSAEVVFDVWISFDVNETTGAPRHSSWGDVFVDRLGTVFTDAYGVASLPFQVPTRADIFSSDGYFLRAFLADAAYASNTSAFFSIATPSLTVNSPSYETWMTSSPGDLVNVSWSSSHVSSPATTYLAIDLYELDTSTWELSFAANVFTAAPVADGSELVQIPTTSLNGYYLFYVYAWSADSYVYFSSDDAAFEEPSLASCYLFSASSFFEIRTNRSIVVQALSTNSTLELQGGDAFTATWYTIGYTSTASFNASLVDAATGVDVAEIGSFMENDFWQQFAVPVSPPGTAWRAAQRLSFVIRDAIDGRILGQSATTVYVAPPVYTLAITQPTAGALVQGGANLAVTWTSTGLTPRSNCRVDLFQANPFGADINVTTIVGFVPCISGGLKSGAYDKVSLTVPLTLSSSQRYFVIASTVDTAPLFGRSDYFYLSSKPLPDFGNFTTRVCAVNPLLSICKVTCAACQSAGLLWLTAVSVKLDFNIDGFLGSVDDVIDAKNLLGAFSSSGQSLCWPSPAKPIYALSGVGSLYAASLSALGANALSVSNVTLTLSGSLTPAADCSALAKVVALTTFPSVSTATDLNRMRADIQTGVAAASGRTSFAVEVDVILNVTSGAATVIRGNGRRLGAVSNTLSSSGTQTVSATIVIPVENDVSGREIAKNMASTQISALGLKGSPSQPTLVANAAAGVITSGTTTTTLASTTSTKPVTGNDLVAATRNPAGAVVFLVKGNALAAKAGNAALIPPQSSSASPSAAASPLAPSATPTPGTVAIALTLKLSFSSTCDLTTETSMTALRHAMATTFSGAVAGLSVPATRVFITKIADAATGLTYFSRPRRRLGIIASAYVVSFTLQMASSGDAAAASFAASTPTFLTSFKNNTVSAYTAALAASGLAGSPNIFLNLATPAIVTPTTTETPTTLESLTEMYEALNTRAKIGIVLGVIVFVAGCAIAARHLYKRQTTKTKTAPEPLGQVTVRTPVSGGESQNEG